MKTGRSTIAVLGLGRTGLPVALVAARAGFDVLGIDTNHTTINLLKSGECPFDEPGMQTLLKENLGRTFKCILLSSITPAEWSKVETVLVHVGLSLDKVSHQLPNEIELFSTLAGLGLQGKTIVLRTTVQVGLTRRLAHFMEQRTGLKEGHDFFVVYVPERLWEGRAIADSGSLPHLIGGLSPKSCPRDHHLFEKLGTGRVIHVSAPEVAEIVKLAENAWRDTNFAFANDLAMLCDNLGVDLFEVLRAANTPDYPWNNIPLPGPVSGYCLKKDPVFLARSESDGMERLWVHGRRSNERLVQETVSRMKRSGAAKFLIAGVSFKKDVDDFRDSHSLDLIRMLSSNKSEVACCDPYLDNGMYSTLPQDMSIKKFKSIQEAGLWLEGAAVVLSTPHSSFKSHSETSALIQNKPSLILDLWALWRDIQDEMKNHGIEYACLGSGNFWDRCGSKWPLKGRNEKIGGRLLREKTS